MKHTPGPFYRLMQVPGGDALICAEVKYRGRVEIATVHKEAEYAALPVNENSALFAAAPELLEAVKACLEILEMRDSRITFQAQLRELISKAEGENP